VAKKGKFLPDGIIPARSWKPGEVCAPGIQAATHKGKAPEVRGLCGEFGNS